MTAHYLVQDGLWIGPMTLDHAQAQASDGRYQVHTAEERDEHLAAERAEGVGAAFRAVGLANVRRIEAGLYQAPSFVLRQAPEGWRAIWLEGAYLAAGPGDLAAVAAEMATAIDQQRH